jgi:hypothetical protein
MLGSKFLPAQYQYSQLSQWGAAYRMNKRRFG